MSKGIGQNARDHKALDTMGRADMQMTQETLYLRAIKHGRSPDCAVTYQTTLRRDEC